MADQAYGPDYKGIAPSVATPIRNKPTSARYVIDSSIPGKTADFADERTYGAGYAQQEQSARDILGPDTFRRRDRSSSIWPNPSEGAQATLMLDSDLTPSEVSRRIVGSRDRDIELSKDPVKAKPIAKPRTLAGGRR